MSTFLGLDLVESFTMLGFGTSNMPKPILSTYKPSCRASSGLRLPRVISDVFGKAFGKVPGKDVEYRKLRVREPAGFPILP